MFTRFWLALPCFFAACQSGTDVLASHFDQSCSKAADCVAVAEVTVSSRLCAIDCPRVAINVSAKAAFDSASAAARATCSGVSTADCIGLGGAICIGHHCELPASTASCGTGSALSICQTPTHPADYYVQQGLRYFDALDVSAPAENTPTYAQNVIRWEWPPWLKLTGYQREQMAALDGLVKKQAPAVISHRDCRFFDVQPFARCRVSFDYKDQGNGKPCFIYEEFSFNDAGEITFIEAWADLPQYTPVDRSLDPWAEGRDIKRLSTRIPGLGASPPLNLHSAAIQTAAAADADLADLIARADDFWPAWFAESDKEGPDYFAHGCGW